MTSTIFLVVPTIQYLFYNISLRVNSYTEMAQLIKGFTIHVGTFISQTPHEIVKSDDGCTGSTPYAFCNGADLGRRKAVGALRENAPLPPLT